MRKKQAILIAMVTLLVVGVFLVRSRTLGLREGDPKPSDTKSGAIAGNRTIPPSHSLGTGKFVQAILPSPERSSARSDAPAAPHSAAAGHGITPSDMFRTGKNKERILDWVEDKVLSERLATILLGEEQSADALAQERSNLLGLIHNEKQDILLRRYGVAALGLYRDGDTFNSVLGLATDDATDHTLRRTSYFVLSTWVNERPEATDVLIKRLAGDPSSLKASTLELLAYMEVPIPLQILVSIARNDRGVAASFAVDVLGHQQGQQAIPFLEDLAATADKHGLGGTARHVLDSIKENGRYNFFADGESEEPYSSSETIDGKEVVLRSIDFPPGLLLKKR